MRGGSLLAVRLKANSVSLFCERGMKTMTYLSPLKTAPQRTRGEHSLHDRKARDRVFRLLREGASSRNMVGEISGYIFTLDPCAFVWSISSSKHLSNTLGNMFSYKSLILPSSGGLALSETTIARWVRSWRLASDSFSVSAS